MKHNKLFNWLFSLFMLLPMIAIGVKCLYVSFNKNANQSYYGDTINQVQYNDVTTLTIDNKYYFINDDTTAFEFSNEYTFKITNVSNYNIPNINSSLRTAIENNEVDNMRFTNSNNRALLNIRDSNNNNLQNFFFDTTQLSFEFDLLTLTNQPTSYYKYFKTIEYNNYSYLDNAFYYAIDEFNQCGFNKVDFVGWFDFFHTQNNIYIEFANTYINYMLFVTLAFFIPRVLMWFVGYAYGLTDSWSGRSKLW